MLIIIVLGGVVIWFVVGFIERTHEASLDLTVGVREAEIACIVDGVTCKFTSEASAKEYLESKAHLDAVKSRTEKKKIDDEVRTRVDELVKKGKKGVTAACRKDGTLNCNLIDEATLTTFAESIVKNDMAKEAQEHKDGN